MAHMFRKYTSNRGSALFMVISTMTALFISCMAMYFSMASARSSQYMVYNQTQANQTTMSISRLVMGELTNLQLDDAGNVVLSDLYNAVDALEEGEYITTDANGFKSLDPGIDSLGPDDPNLGAYSVTITCEKDNGDGTKVIDVMVLASVDGSRDAIHIKIPNFGAVLGDGDPGDAGGGDAELFAATGYMPNDAYIDSGYYLTDVFYDTQFTYMNTFDTGGSHNRIGYSMRTGGDLFLGANGQSVVHAANTENIDPNEVAEIGPTTWAIRGNFYPTLSSDMAIRGGSEILVGGNYYKDGEPAFQPKNSPYNGHLPIGNSQYDHINIYVNGDFYYGNNQIKGNTWIFVNGNFVCDNTNPPGNNVRIFVTGDRTAKKAYCKSQVNLEEWPKSGTFAYGMTYTEFLEKLGRETATVAYYKWDLSGETKSAPKIDIRINATTSDWNGIPANQYTYIIAHDKNTDMGKLVDEGKEAGVIGDSFVINSVLTHGDNDHAQTIVIDTGDDPDNVITIKASDISGGDGIFSWFYDNLESWNPSSPMHTPTGDLNDKRKRSVLVFGRGTVLIDVPNGITYQDAGSQFTGHIGWWLIEANKQGGNYGAFQSNGHLTFEGVKGDGQYSATVASYIHKVCEPGDGCVQHEKTDNATKCQDCGGKMTVVSCDKHGDQVGRYCSVCHPEKSITKKTNWCKSHFERAKFENFYKNTLSNENRALVTDKKGIVYPTTNFMLISCDEGSDMRFTVMKDNKGIEHNQFFGFIYAPYVSYRAAANYTMGGEIGLVGGMTVSDYDLSNIKSYIGCYPDKMPMDLAGMGIGKAGSKLQGTSKSWKVEVGGYY